MYLLISLTASLRGQDWSARSHLDHPDAASSRGAQEVGKLIAAPNPRLTPHHQSEEPVSRVGKKEPHNI